jgi:hypothetical protein
VPPTSIHTGIGANVSQGRSVPEAVRSCRSGNTIRNKIEKMAGGSRNEESKLHGALSFRVCGLCATASLHFELVAHFHGINGPVATVVAPMDRHNS